MIKALSFFLGLLVFSNQTTTNFNFYLLLIILFLVIISFKINKKIIQYLIIFILGYSWFYCYLQITYNPIDKNFYNQKINIIGVIEEVENKTDKTNLIINTSLPFNAKLKLSNYHNEKFQFKIGEKWQLGIKLKTPNTYFNTASFDYEKYLFSKKINGVGYLLPKYNHKLIAKTNNYKINQIRQNISNKIKELSNTGLSGVITAITVGDKSSINNTQKDILLKTNTSHLSVISGLHIGMIASFAFILSLIIFSGNKIINKIPLKIISSIIAIIFAGFYTILAGFSLPTTRAFIMLLVFLLGLIWRNNYNRWQLFALALFIILAINPLAILSVSFYLSFIIVAIIIYFGANFIRSNNLFGRIKIIIIMQLVISIFSALLSSYFFGFISLSSFVANLIAIPIFSFIIVPFSLIAVVFISIELNLIATYILNFVSFNLNYLFDFLEFLANINYLTFNYKITNLWLIFLLSLTLILFFNSKTLRFLPFAILLSISFILQKNTNNNFVVLDVGQGSAAILANKNNTIIFDTGNKFRSGFSLANAVIIPWLSDKNINNINNLIISHNDIDHRGGEKDLQERYAINNIINPKNCKQQILNFGNNKLQIFSTDNKFKGNNSSCVVKIITPNLDILLSGDIEKKAEEYLIKKYNKKLKSDVLIVPHHGSKTSSSLEFLQVVKPKIAIISAGFENRYNHPHSSVIQRYKDLNIKILNTACSGEININLDNNKILEMRKEKAKFYHRRCL